MGVPNFPILPARHRRRSHHVSASPAMDCSPRPHSPSSPAQPIAQVPTLGKIERNDPAFDAWFPRTRSSSCSSANKFDWSEGPVWDKANKRVLFSDIPKNMIWKWSREGGLKEFLKPSGYTGTDEVHRPRARLERPGLRQGRRAAPVQARRPPAGQAGSTASSSPSPTSTRQAAQQPERPDLQVERRHLLHRPAVRPAEER